MNKYFNIKDSLYDITEKYPETLSLFVSTGFEDMRDEEKRKSFGKAISLEMALSMKKINVETFVGRLVEIIEEKKNIVDETLIQNTENKEADIRIDGVLPCPVRIPLMDSFNKWMDEKKDDLNITIDYELKAASSGIDWLKESLENAKSEKDISDIFISAGFDLFFDKDLMGKFKAKGVFKDMTGFNRLNADFYNEYINLKDPESEYSIIGTVPAVFLVNREELKGREIPRSWKDILSEEFENAVSLPIGDFDLFNAILLNIYKKYGEDGIRKLGKSLLKSMHPSEMVKSHMKKMERPVVTIMPYFFTKMTKENGPMVAVWPSDGAIISPIFLLTKKSKEKEIKPFVDFFASKKVGEILAHNGRFPSTNPEVDNMVSKDNKYMWLGWDYISENDIGEKIKICEELFNESI
ncbi:ABC transporter substrate-binding protein [Anaerosalibacter massiliensis]|uniref:ABC transporter substrate-binding protein n=1 Tax=Anaerosalibacter massiliensis TaxID=1347392 RepID=A0A9X2MHH3_9FIRM|nr:ABC transporter substrate-binding protein [Anaerosalibacter massiliensis]MCR2043586.1 ABC transporter substrate-binding protein [Anaerosalibacter massiliensis]